MTDHFMTTAPPVADIPSMTVDTYRRLAESGAIAEGTPLELLGGVLVLKDRRDGGGDVMTVGRRHAAAIRRLERLLSDAVGGRLFVVQSRLPVVVDDESAPEPDVALLSGRVEDYDQREPTAADVVLLIEVADGSLAYGRGRKRTRYQAAGIRDYWVLNLQNDTLEQYPDGPTPAVVDPIETGEVSVLFVGETVSVERMFPPA